MNRDQPKVWNHDNRINLSLANMSPKKMLASKNGDDNLSIKKWLRKSNKTDLAEYIQLSMEKSKLHDSQMFYENFKKKMDDR